MSGIGGHQSAVSKTDEWLTPKYIIDQLGPFDLDPCAPEERPWRTADRHYTFQDNGLLKEWDGYVWMNPPYGQQTEAWLNRISMHGNGIALVFARTETRMFFESVWGRAEAIFFIKGRLYFYNTKGERASANSGAPSCLIAYGSYAREKLKHCEIKGQYIEL